MHHYTMVHVNALKCVCVLCVCDWVCVFALKYLNALKCVCCVCVCVRACECEYVLGCVCVY